MAIAKKIAPALMKPCSSVSMVSLGSIGESVEPVTSHWATWIAMKTWSATSAAARHGPIRSS
jgi:hypothetical protein